MYKSHRVVVVLPAYNAEKTLQKTIEELPDEIIDDIVLCDDASQDNTKDLAHRLGIPHILHHQMNKGYGANQKSLYDYAVSINGDIIVMLHPDYQYPPNLIPSMVSLIVEGGRHVVLGSRILGRGALKGGMPLYKYVSNRFLTFVQNAMIGYKLSEYHTGYRVYTREVLEKVDYHKNSDDFVFDNQILSQIIYCGFDIHEISCPTRYSPDSSSINFGRSIKYGLGVLLVSAQHFFQKRGWWRFERYGS